MKKTIATLVLLAVFGFAVMGAEARTANPKAKGQAAVSAEAKVKVGALAEVKAKRVEAKTKAAATGNASGTVPCVKPAWGHLFAKGWLKKNVSPALPTCAVPPGIAKKLGHATSTPKTDTVAPTLSGIIATSSPSTLTVQWNTNEKARGTVYLSATSPVSTASSTVMIQNSLSTVHTVIFTGLTANTTYHFLVESKDASGNTATSSQQSATTLAFDVTAPVISSTSVTGVASTSATVSWGTNEPATGKLTYAATSSLAGASTVTNSILAGSQTVNLSGLTASTTYYFTIEAKDASGNAATTSVQSFVTAQ